MTNTTTTPAVRNINPLTVDVSPELMATFDAVAQATDAVALSTAALRRAAESAGIKVTYFTAPGKDATPEHRHGYAVLQRLAVGKLAALLGATPDAFEPIFNGAVQYSTEVKIGEEARQKRAWQQRLSNTLRPVKDAWTASIRSEVAEAKAVLTYAKGDLTAAQEAATKTADEVDKCEANAKAVADKVIGLTDAMDKATGKDKAKLAAQVKAANAARLEALNVLAAAEEADRMALLTVAEQREVVEECETEVLVLSKALPAARGATNRKTDAEAAIAKIDLMITAMSASDGTGYGSADLAEAVYHLKMARAALNAPAH